MLPTAGGSIFFLLTRVSAGRLNTKKSVYVCPHVCVTVSHWSFNKSCLKKSKVESLSREAGAGAVEKARRAGRQTADEASLATDSKGRGWEGDNLGRRNYTAGEYPHVTRVTIFILFGGKPGLVEVDTKWRPSFFNIFPPAQDFL